MAEVHITLNGRPYEISCDDGQEGRIVNLAAHIDHQLQTIARSGGAYNDAHLMVLTALVLTDQLFDARDEVTRSKEVAANKGAVKDPAQGKAEEKAMLSVLDQITKRIEGIAARVDAA